MILIFLVLVPGIISTDNEPKKNFSIKGGLKWSETGNVSDRWINIVTMQEFPTQKIRRYFIRKTPSPWALSVNYLPSENKVRIKHRIQENTIQLPQQNRDSRWKKFLRLDVEFADNEYNLNFNQQIRFKIYDSVYSYWNVSRRLRHLSRYFRVIEDTMINLPPPKINIPTKLYDDIKLDDYSPSGRSKYLNESSKNLNTHSNSVENSNKLYARLNSVEDSNKLNPLSNSVEDSNKLNEHSNSVEDSNTPEVSSAAPKMMLGIDSSGNAKEDKCSDNSEKILTVLIDLKRLVDNLQRSLQTQYKEIQSLGGMMLMRGISDTNQTPKTCLDRPCYPGVSCEDNEEGFECGPCPPRMMSEGTGCRRIMCSDRPCFKDVECYDSYGGGFSCSKCPQGFFGDGTKDGCLQITDDKLLEK